MAADILLDLAHALAGLWIFAVAIAMLIILCCARAMRKASEL